MKWDTSLPDWADRIERGKSLIPDLPLNAAEADKAVKIFDRLRIPDVVGQPTLAQAGGEWFRDIVRVLFGSYDQKTKERIIREFFVLVPKKNGKTTYSAALMITALCMNQRRRAEFMLVAPTQEVTDLAFRQAVGMLESDDTLAKLFHVQEHLKKITLLKTGAFLKVKSFDPKIVVGSKASGILIDELHAVADFPNADRVIGQLRGGMVSQPEAFLLIITTQSERPPSGIFKAELQNARKVRDGTMKAPALPVLYELPPQFNVKDPANWAMVTPNAGRSITIERLIEEYDRAQETGEEEVRRWLTQHVNAEIGLALRSDRWAGADHWQTQVEPGLTFAEILRRSEVITVGGDGGGLDDMLAIAVLGRCKTTRKWLLWVHAWIHESVLELRKSEAARFRDFERDGDLTIVKRQEDAFIAFAEYVEQVNDAGLLAKVGLDPYGVGMIVEEMARRGITQDGGQVEGVSQGYKLTGTIKTAEVQLADGNLLHCGQALMAWCVSNAKVEPKGNAVVVTKQASGAGKIDPVMAAFNSVKLMAENPRPVAISVFEILAAEAAARAQAGGATH